MDYTSFKLDDVFRDVFDKSSHSITEYMSVHPGELFDATPFVDRRCKTPIEKSRLLLMVPFSEQVVKLRQCLTHIDEPENHLIEMAREIPRLSDKHKIALDLIHTVPGFTKNPTFHELSIVSIFTFRIRHKDGLFSIQFTFF